MLTEIDYVAAAERLGVPIFSIKAVAQVEAMGNGFLPDGRAKILFEAHHFGARTGHQYDSTYPDISSPNWNEARKHYVGDAGEYDRQNKAKILNEDAALESASYGAFQVMGFNWKILSYTSVQELVEKAKTDEGQLDMFIRYIENNGLAMHMKRFPDISAIETFTAGYNGTGQIDVYAPRILAACLIFMDSAPITSSGKILRKGDTGDAVMELQRALGVFIDGDFGPNTEQAVRALQANNGLEVDGVVGPKTWDVLNS